MMATQSEKKKILEENLLLQYIFILVETHSSLVKQLAFHY